MIVATVIIVLVYASKGLVTSGPINDGFVPVNSTKMWHMVGFSFYSFEGIGTVMPIRACSKDPEQFPKLLTLSILSLGCMYITFGLVCYAYFGNMKGKFVIYNLDQSDNFIKFTELAFCINLVLTYPLAIFPTNQILESFLFQCISKDTNMYKWL